MGKALSGIGHLLARYLNKETHQHGAMPNHTPEQLLATLRPGDVLLVEGNRRVSYPSPCGWSHKLMKRFGMKRLCWLLLATLLAVNSAWAQSHEYQLGVDGLACPFCAYGIEKQLQKLDGVQSVEVDIAKGHVVVTMQDDRQLQREQAEQAVKKAGFSLRSFDRVQEKTP